MDKIKKSNIFTYFHNIALFFVIYILLSTKGTFVYGTIKALDTLTIFIYILMSISILLLITVSAISHKSQSHENGITNNGKPLTVNDKNKMSFMITQSFSRLKVAITFNLILLMLINEVTKNYFVNDIILLNTKGQIIYYTSVFMSMLWFLPYYDIGKVMFYKPKED